MRSSPHSASLALMLFALVGVPSVSVAAPIQPLHGAGIPHEPDLPLARVLPHDPARSAAEHEAEGQPGAAVHPVVPSAFHPGGNPLVTGEQAGRAPAGLAGVEPVRRSRLNPFAGAQRSWARLQYNLAHHEDERMTARQWRQYEKTGELPPELQPENVVQKKLGRVTRPYKDIANHMERVPDLDWEQSRIPSLFDFGARYLLDLHDYQAKHLSEFPGWAPDIRKTELQIWAVRTQIQRYNQRAREGGFDFERDSDLSKNLTALLASRLKRYERQLQDVLGPDHPGPRSPEEWKEIDPFGDLEAYLRGEDRSRPLEGISNRAIRSGLDRVSHPPLPWPKFGPSESDRRR